MKSGRHEVSNKETLQIAYLVIFSVQLKNLISVFSQAVKSRTLDALNLSNYIQIKKFYFLPNSWKFFQTNHVPNENASLFLKDHRWWVPK